MVGPDVEGVVMKRCPECHDALLITGEELECQCGWTGTEKQLVECHECDENES